jgi:four helix bundle protein
VISFVIHFHSEIRGDMMKKVYHAHCFRDLLVYQKAQEVAESIFEKSKNFPREELFALTDQIRRASRAIGAQLAEAWGKRRYEKHFISKLTDADAEQLETQHWLGIAVSCGYLSKVDEEKLLDQLKEIGRMINGMMLKANLFCGQEVFKIQEETEIFSIKNH